jgi:putative Mn2+ efflux pump MntP
MGIGTSILLIAVGAILDFAVKVNNTHFNINTIGLILMIVGAVGLIISLFFWNSWGGFGRAYGRRSVYRDSRGNTVVEEHRDMV